MRSIERRIQKLMAGRWRFRKVIISEELNVAGEMAGRCDSANRLRILAATEVVKVRAQCADDRLHTFIPQPDFAIRRYKIQPFPNNSWNSFSAILKKL